MKSNIQLHNGLRAFTSDFGAILVALSSITSASAQTNTSTGTKAGAGVTTGLHNTADGYTALQANKTGRFNTAIGSSALLKSTGASNVAVGFEALWKNTTGSLNVAVGDGALRSNTKGSGNIGIGEDAGINLTVGSDNICIDNKGIAAESGQIRIGTSGIHTHTYLAGVIHGNGSGLTNLPISPGTGGGSVLPSGMKEFATPNIPGGSYTFTVPGAVSRIMVEVWGAGGGGGGGYGDYTILRGAGGGSGAYSRKILSVTSGQIFDVTIGTGGVGGKGGFFDEDTSTPTSGTSGLVGGKSSFIAARPFLQKVTSEGGGGGGGGVDNNGSGVGDIGGIGGVADAEAVIGREGGRGQLPWVYYGRSKEPAGGLAFTQVPVGPPAGACNGGLGGLGGGNTNTDAKGGDGYVLITW